MRPPDRYSASPLHSFVTTPIRRAPSFSETVRAIWWWLRGVKPTARDRQIAEAVVERLAAEIEEGRGGDGATTSN